MKQRTIKVNYKNLKLRIAVKFRKGAGISIVIIHGLLGCKEFYDKIWNIAEYRGFSILALDLIGFGNSSKPKKFSYDLADQAEICKLVIKKLDIDNINLICHSMGGAIGLLLYNKISNRIISYISLEGSMIKEDLTISRTASRFSYPEFRGKIFRRIIESIRNAKNQKKEFWDKWNFKGTSYVFYKSSKSLVKWCDSKKLLDIFNKLKIRKAYIFGSRNSGMPILSLIKHDSQLVKITKSGHFMMIDNPKEFYSKLLKVLQTNQ